jgi:DNA-binding transcriptional LysR family regulator
MHGRRLVCAAPKYWQLNGYPKHPNQLLEYNCFFLSDENVKRDNWKFKDQSGVFSVKVQGNRTANDGSILYYWALAGQGVTLQMEWDILPDIAAGRIEVVLDEYVAQSYNLYAVYHPQANMKVVAWVNFLIKSLSK